MANGIKFTNMCNLKTYDNRRFEGVTDDEDDQDAGELWLAYYFYDFSTFFNIT